MFDRGWYSDACIQWVAGDGSLDAYHGTIEQCVATEARFVEAGVVLRKYWFSVSEEEQERRLQRRLSHPQRSIPDTPTDTEIRHRWVEYFKALEEAVIRTDTADSPWWVVDADSKPRARVNCIAHLLGSVPWRDRPLSEVGASREDELFHHVPDVVDVLARRPVDVDQRAWS